MKPVRHVALLIEASRAYGRGLLRGIADHVRTHRRWSVYHQSRGPEDPPPPWLEGWKGDGILVRVESREMADAVRRTGVPAIDLRGVLKSAMPLLETDDNLVCKLAFEHLAERGFRRFAYCGFAGANYSEKRLASFRKSVAAAGLELQVHQSPVAASQGLALREQAAVLYERQMLDWLAGLARPVGVMACNDVCGQQVLNACRELGIAVPDQAAVIGVDDDELHCELSDPPLTSVAPDTVRIGRQAAEWLDRMMDGGPAPAEPIYVPPRGVAARQSTDVLAIDDADVAAAVRFIRRHACDGIGVPEVLEHIPLSRRVLERRFRERLDRTPNEEIVRVRVRRAVELLTGTDLPLAAIAEAAGFRHAEYMTAVFRRELNQTPSGVRNGSGPRK